MSQEVDAVVAVTRLQRRAEHLDVSLTAIRLTLERHGFRPTILRESLSELVERALTTLEGKAREERDRDQPPKVLAELRRQRQREELVEVELIDRHGFTQKTKAKREVLRVRHSGRWFKFWHDDKYREEL